MLPLDLSFGEFLGFLLSVVYFQGLGSGILSVLAGHLEIDATDHMALVIALSCGAWPIIFLWLSTLGIDTNPLVVHGVLLAGWAVALGRWLLNKQQHLNLAKQYLRETAPVLVILSLVGIASFMSVREAVTGMGTDSYHHSLIVQMMLELGHIPASFAPYAPTQSFTYHFGFHTIATLLAHLSGLASYQVVPLLGQLFIPFASIGVYFLAHAALKNKPAAWVAALAVGLFSAFPSFYVVWGRYTQLTGLILALFFLGLAFHCANLELKWKNIVMVGLVSAGLSLVHYRATFIAVIGWVSFFAVWFFLHNQKAAFIKRTLLFYVPVIVLALVFVLPWLLRIVQFSGVGVSPGLTGDVFGIGVRTDNLFYFIALPGRVVQSPLNLVFNLLAVVGAIWGIFRPDRSIFFAGLWFFLMVAVSGPRFGGAYLDTGTIAISLFAPLSIMLGFLVANILKHHIAQTRVARVLAGVGFIAMLLYGIVHNSGFLNLSRDSLVFRSDMRAMAWISENTPENAAFYVNTNQVGFWREMIIAPDAGYWIPLLAKRATMVLPMASYAERFQDQETIARVVAWTRLFGDVSLDESIDIMKKSGFNYIYIGERGGRLDPQVLIDSGKFVVAYQDEKVFVLRINAP